MCQIHRTAHSERILKRTLRRRSLPRVVPHVHVRSPRQHLVPAVTQEHRSVLLQLVVALTGRQNHVRAVAGKGRQHALYGPVVVLPERVQVDDHHILQGDAGDRLAAIHRMQRRVAIQRTRTHLQRLTRVTGLTVHMHQTLRGSRLPVRPLLQRERRSQLVQRRILSREVQPEPGERRAHGGHLVAVVNNLQAAQSRLNNLLTSQVLLSELVDPVGTLRLQSETCIKLAGLSNGHHLERRQTTVSRRTTKRCFVRRNSLAFEQTRQLLLLELGELTCPWNHVRLMKRGGPDFRGTIRLPHVVLAVQLRHRLIGQADQLSFSREWGSPLTISSLLERQHLKRAISQRDPHNVAHLHVLHHRPVLPRVPGARILSATQAALGEHLSRQITNHLRQVRLPTSLQSVHACTLSLLRSTQRGSALLARIKRRRRALLHNASNTGQTDAGKRRTNCISLGKRALEEDVVRHVDRLIVRVEHLERDRHLVARRTGVVLHNPLDERFQTLRAQEPVPRVLNLFRANIDRGRRIPQVQLSLLIQPGPPQLDLHSTNSTALQIEHIHLFGRTVRTNQSNLVLKILRLRKQRLLWDHGSASSCTIRGRENLRNITGSLNGRFSATRVHTIRELQNVHDHRIRRLTEETLLRQLLLDQSDCLRLINYKRIRDQTLSQRQGCLDHRRIHRQEVVDQPLVGRIEHAQVFVRSPCQRKQHSARHSSAHLLLNHIRHHNPGQLSPLLLRKLRQALTIALTLKCGDQGLTERRRRQQLTLSLNNLHETHSHRRSLNAPVLVLLIDLERVRLVDLLQQQIAVHAHETLKPLSSFLQSNRICSIRGLLDLLRRKLLQRTNLRIQLLIQLTPNNCVIRHSRHVIQLRSRHVGTLTPEDLRVAHRDLHRVHDLRQRSKAHRQLGRSRHRSSSELTRITHRLNGRGARRRISRGKLARVNRRSVALRGRIQHRQLQRTISP